MIEEKIDIRMVDLKGQYDRIKPEVDAIIQNVIDDSAFIKGKYVKGFCSNLSTYLGVDHVIPCGNGTDALQLALMAMEYEPGSEIITTPFTFVATVEVICLLGLKPVFVDVKPDSFNLDPQLIEAAITDKTRCIIPVHLFGQSADMEPIMTIAQKHNLNVIEDNAQSISGHYRFSDGSTKNLGTIGDIGTFSFFPSKNLGCYGDGGAICTSDADLAHKLHLYANHGSLKKYHYDSIGINSRLDGIQAGILDVKLRHLDDYVKRRVQAADIYDKLLKDVPGVILPKRMENRNHVFHQYTIKIKNRDSIKAFLTTHGIPTGVYYPSPLHMQGIYSEYAPTHKLSVTEQLCDEVLSLPMHTELNLEQQTFIIDMIKEGLTTS